MINDSNKVVAINTERRSNRSSFDSDGFDRFRLAATNVERVLIRILTTNVNGSLFTD